MKEKETKTVWIREDDFSDIKTVWTGMKPFKKRNLPKGSLSYIKEQIERPVRDSITNILEK